jgi:hypothetical protein
MALSALGEYPHLGKGSAFKHLFCTPLAIIATYMAIRALVLLENAMEMSLLYRNSFRRMPAIVCSIPYRFWAGFNFFLSGNWSLASEHLVTMVTGRNKSGNGGF